MAILALRKNLAAFWKEGAKLLQWNPAKNSVGLFKNIKNASFKPWRVASETDWTKNVVNFKVKYFHSKLNTLFTAVRGLNPFK